MGPVESEDVLKAPADFPAMNICLLAPNYAARACKCHKCNGEHDNNRFLPYLNRENILPQRSDMVNLLAKWEGIQRQVISYSIPQFISYLATWNFSSLIMNPSNLYIIHLY